MTNVTVTNIDNSILNPTEIPELWRINFLEFKDETFRRFEIETMRKWFANFKSNEEFIEYSSLPKVNIRLCKLPELYKHDVQYYGTVENAIQMWQWRYVDKSKWITEDGWTNCNKDLSFNPNKEYRRKESAGLPFDLGRANSKEVVERLLPNGTWYILNMPNSVGLGITFQEFGPDHYQILNCKSLSCHVNVVTKRLISDDLRFIVSKSDLRMRFPKREIK